MSSVEPSKSAITRFLKTIKEYESHLKQIQGRTNNLSE